MDIRPFIFLYKVRKLTSEFELWRENIVKKTNSKCRSLIRDKEFNIDDYPVIIVDYFYFPKTIARLTRQMCLCHQYCVEYSMYNTEFDESCIFYDLENLLTDDKYYETELIDEKVISGRFEKDNGFVSTEELYLDIYNGIWNLCLNEANSLTGLSCKAYELRDYCKKNNTCYDIMLEHETKLPYFDNILSKNLCKNSHYRSSLNSIEKKNSLPRLYRESRSKREIQINTEIESLVSKNITMIRVLSFLPIICIGIFMMIYLFKKKNYVLFASIAVFCCFLMVLTV